MDGVAAPPISIHGYGYGYGYGYGTSTPFLGAKVECFGYSTTFLSSKSRSKTAKRLVKAVNVSRSRAKRGAAITQLEHSSDLKFALSRFGEILEVPDLNIILRNLGRSKRWNHLSQLFEWMQKYDKVNIASYSSYIKFMGENKDIAKALTVYETIDDQAIRNNVSICNSVLSCLVKNNNFDKAMIMFGEMKRNGLQPDVVTYSTLLAGCLKVEHGYAKALELVKELEHNSILMDFVTYGTLIAVCASHCQCKEAEMYFNRMQAEGHSPNMYHYSSLLNAYSCDGNYLKADQLVQDMKSAGFSPNKVVLTTLLKVYVRGGLFESSRSLLSKLESLGYADNEMPYCLLMDGLSKSGNIHDAKLTFDRMKERKVRSDGYSHSIMITAFCRVGYLVEAKKLARDYEALYNKYDLVILNVLLCAYCRAGDMQCVMQTLKKMDELAINSDQNTFQILIKYFCKEKLYLLAYRTLRDMRDKGHQPEEGVLSTLLLHLGKVGAHKEAFDVYNILKSGDEEICNSNHEKILYILIAGNCLENAFSVVKDYAKFLSPPAVKEFLRVFLTSGDINLINDRVEALQNAGHEIDQEIFQLIISRYIAKPETTKLLLQLLQWMSNHGYVMDPSTRKFLLNSNLNKHPLICEIFAKQHAIARK